MIAVISLVVSIIGMAATVTTAIVTSYANIQRSRQVPKPNIKAELRSVKVDHPTPRKGVLFPENHPDIVIKAMATIRFTNYGVGDAYDIHVKATQDRLPVPHEPREISIARMKNGDYFEIRVPVSCQFGHIPDDTEDEWSGTVDYNRINLEFTWKTAANQNEVQHFQNFPSAVEAWPPTRRNAQSLYAEQPQHNKDVQPTKRQDKPQQTKG